MSMLDMLDEDGQDRRSLRDLSYSDIMKEKPKSKWEKVADSLNQIGKGFLEIDAGAGAAPDRSKSLLKDIYKQESEDKDRKIDRQNMLIKLKQQEEDREAQREMMKQQKDLQRQAQGNIQQQRLDQRDEAIHNQKVRQFSSDRVLNNQIMANNRVSNTLGLLENAAKGNYKLTVNMLPDLQQAETAAFIGGGESTGAEREARVMGNTFFQQYMRLKEKVTNSPQGLDINDPMVKQVIATAKEAQRALSASGNKRIDQISSSHGSFYSKRKDLGEDYTNTINQYRSSFVPLETKELPQIQPNQQDTKLPLVGNVHPQDNEAVKWARANLKDPRAKAILQANGVQ